MNDLYASLQLMFHLFILLTFSSGLVPRLIGEAITIALINLLSDLLNEYLVEDKVRWTDDWLGIHVLR